LKGVLKQKRRGHGGGPETADQGELVLLEPGFLVVFVLLERHRARRCE